MIINGKSLLKLKPIKNMISTKKIFNGMSYGLSEIGYDIRLKQTIKFNYLDNSVETYEGNLCVAVSIGKFVLASSIEEFQIPNNLWCEFRNKSSWARQGVDATLCTDGEPGWKGFLTIELVFHGNKDVTILAGSPILKAVFHEIKEPAQYNGKYQNQPDNPIKAIYEKSK